MLNDEQILERGGTEEDVADYAHDVGGACMYPKYECEICKKRLGEDYKINSKKMNTKEFTSILDFLASERSFQPGEIRGILIFLAKDAVRKVLPLEKIREAEAKMFSVTAEEYRKGFNDCIKEIKINLKEIE